MVNHYTVIRTVILSNLYAGSKLTATHHELKQKCIFFVHNSKDYSGHKDILNKLM